MKRAVLSRGQPRTKVGARHRPKLVPAARTLGTARSPAYAHGHSKHPKHLRHALVWRERASDARRPPQACLHHRTDGHRQDRTAYQSDARRPAWRRGLLPSRPAWRREQRDRRRDAARAHEGHDLSRSIRPHPHFRLQSPLGRGRERAGDSDGQHHVGFQEHLEPELGASAGIYSHQFAPAPARC